MKMTYTAVEVEHIKLVTRLASNLFRVRKNRERGIAPALTATVLDFSEETIKKFEDAIDRFPAYSDEAIAEILLTAKEEEMEEVS